MLEDLGDVNTGDPQVLADFIAEGIAAVPRRALRADHLRPRRLVARRRRRRVRPTPTGSASPRSTTASPTASSEAGVDKLDLLGFDACLMATYEVASTLAPLADRMVASQELEPGHGWDYRALSVLADDPATDVDDARRRASSTASRPRPRRRAPSGEITLSLLDLTQMAGRRRGDGRVHRRARRRGRRPSRR